MKKFNIEKEILKKSVGLIYKHGFVKATVRDIVKAVGINSSTVYLYFKNKNEILFRIIQDVGSGLISELHTAVEENEDPVECLRAMITRQITFTMQNFKKIKIFLEEQEHLPPSLRKKVLEQYREIYDLYNSKIKELEEKGLLHHADKTVMTFTIFGMINWLYRWFDPNGRLSVEDVAENTVDLFFRAILKNK